MAFRQEKYQQGLSFCADCKEWLPKASFFQEKQRKSGCNPYCKKCLRAKNVTDVVGLLYRQAKYNRAGPANRKKGRKQLPFTITLDYARDLWNEQGQTCAVSGVPFDTSFAVQHNPYSPSLDRIDSTKGYEPGNVRFVLFAINVGMNEWGLDVYIDVAKKALAGSTSSS
jgi:hypothetical protein